MDATVLIIFLLATFAGGVVNGLAGFAFVLFVSGIWLHVFPPLIVTTLAVAFGTTVQAAGVWRLRHEFEWRHITPLAIGGVAGAPLGVWLLTYIDPEIMGLSLGVLLIVYSLYSLLRPAMKPLPANVPFEIVVGFLNGLLGGLAGLTGPVVTIWCGLRGWSKHKQRSVYQPVIFAAFVIAAISLAVSGAFTGEIGKLFLIGLPLLFAGNWVGVHLYGRLSDENFRKIVLALLLGSGIALLVPKSW